MSDASPPLFPLLPMTTSRQPTPQLSGENVQLIEAKEELSRVVAKYGFSVASQAWDWLVVDHNMATGEMLVDPSRSLDPPFAFTPPLMGFPYHHSAEFRLPTPALELYPSPIVEFQFVVSTDDDNSEEEEGKR